jgi:membrane protein YqaA with SNARE-associated domain
MGFSEDASLTGLFVSSFLAATLLPGGSEAVLFAVLKTHPQLIWPALALATLGNTLGGMTSYLLGRWLPDKPLKYKNLMQRFGNPALLLSWVPVIGDGLCVVAGWLRLNPLSAALYMALGKFLRYWLIAQFAH